MGRTVFGQKHPPVPAHNKAYATFQTKLQGTGNQVRRHEDEDIGSEQYCAEEEEQEIGFHYGPSTQRNRGRETSAPPHAWLLREVTVAGQAHAPLSVP